MIKKFSCGIKKMFFISASIAMGILMAFLVSELSYRFYLFGFKLHYQDNRVIDKSIFPKDKNHIFFVGDSFTAGYPFPIDQSYPVILDKKLKNNKVKITNFAFRSSTLYDQLNIIKQISDLSPMLIVWGTATNDICMLPNDKIDLRRLNDYQLRSFPTKKYQKSYFKNILFELPYDCIFRCHMSIFATLKEILNNYSYVYILVRQNLGENKMLAFLKTKSDTHSGLEEIPINVSEYYRNDINPNQVFESALDTILYVKNLLESKKIDFVLFFVPQETDLNQELFIRNIRQFDSKVDNYDRKNPRKILKEFCSNNNITFIDPSDYIESELKQGRLLFMKIDRHYNHLGNKIMAEFLSKNKIFLSKIYSD